MASLLWCMYVYVCHAVGVGVVHYEPWHPTATSVIRHLMEGIIRWTGRKGQGAT